MHFLEIVFCDCSMFCLCGHGVAFILWRLCFLIVPIQAWSFTAQVCASGIQLHLLQKNRLVGASSECRDALKAILATSFFCGYGLALILWRSCFVIVLCFVGAVRGHGTVALKIEFCFLLRWHVTARIDLCLA